MKGSLMTFQITAMYAALIALWAVILSNYVSINRGRLGIQHGDGGNPHMAAIIRRHGNLTENVPLPLLLMLLAEAGGLSAMWLHIIGGILLVSRIIHPFGISVANPGSKIRIAGAVGTHIATVMGAIAVLMQIATN
jgi:uncharacterized protein